MDSFAYGHTIRLRASFQDPDTKELESPLSTPVVTVTKPGGLGTLTPAVSEVSEGIFEASITPAEAEQGVWRYRWDDPVGPGLDPASAESSYFLVRD